MQRGLLLQNVLLGRVGHVKVARGRSKEVVVGVLLLLLAPACAVQKLNLLALGQDGLC